MTWRAAGRESRPRSQTGGSLFSAIKLMGHSDIETTRQYLDPDEALKRKAVNRLSITK
jgi:hypothetical protein